MQVLLICRWLQRNVADVHLFQVELPHDDPFYRRISLLSTRVYIALLTVAIAIIVAYSAVGTTTQLITVRYPSQALYESLLEEYAVTLMCPCSQNTIPYGQFMTVSVKYHEICSSYFVSSDWITTVFSVNMSYYVPIDFRSLASGHFQLLSSLCILAKRSVNHMIDSFLSDTLLSMNVVPSESLQMNARTRGTYARTAIANSVRQILTIIRATMYSNQLQSALQTARLNTFYIFEDGTLAAGLLDGYYEKVDGTRCSCTAMYACTSPSGIFNLYGYETGGIYVFPQAPLVNVTGFKAGCYATEALFQSTLECFSDDACLETVLRFFPIAKQTRIRALATEETRFATNTTLGTLSDELFIEGWSMTISFSAYYNRCAPVSCAYTRVRHNSAMHVLSVLLGLYGGVTVVLRFCIPLVIVWWYRRSDREINANTHMRLRQHVTVLWRRLKTNLIQYNVYKNLTADTDPSQLRTLIISTRVYLISLCLSATILVIFTTLQAHLYVITIRDPSLATYETLQHKYSDAIQCPCSHIAIPYQAFLSFSPTYHPICSSRFLSIEWIGSIEGTINLEFLYSYTDFHTTGQTFFAVLSSLCSLAEATVTNELYIFNQSTLITDHLLSRTPLSTRANAILDQFQSNTVAEFQYALALIRFLMQTMFSAARTNVDLFTNQIISDVNETGQRADFHSIASDYNNCSCAFDDTCQQQINMYSNGFRETYEVQFSVPNFYTGCFVIQSVLQSTLQCFFNQTCLDAVQTEIASNYSINISILDSALTRYPPQTIIAELVDALMIEQWGRQSYYEHYFSQCAPKTCSYTYSSRSSFVYVFTRLIGLIGGLTTVLRVTFKVLVGWIRSRMAQVAPPRNNTINRRILQAYIENVWHSARTKAQQLNIFDSNQNLNNEHHQTHIIATRVYFFVLAISCLAVTIYTLTESYTENVIIDRPCAATFEALHTNPSYSPTLQCPCSNINIPYTTFISLTPQFHQLCSSDFITRSTAWISLVYLRTASLKYRPDDFRIFIVPEFRLLVSLCGLTNETVTKALDLFLASTLVSDQVQSHQTIDAQLTTSMARFQASIARTFVRTLDYMRHALQGNSIVSSILSNWHFLSLNVSQSWTSLWSEPRSYDDGHCSCGTNASCTSPAAIDEWIIPGFLVGCYPHEALLQSTLQCLYDMSCIDKLKTMYYDSNSTFRALNSTLSRPNVTVQSLVDTLMVVEWQSKIFYEQYYTACAPTTCTYSTEHKANALYVINVIIGLYGGLSVALKVIVPVMVRIIRHLLLSRRQQRIQPATIVLD